METLRRLWHIWNRVAQAIGNLIGRAVLTVFYFTLLMPFGLGVRFWGDPLAIKPGHKVDWSGRATDEPRMEEARRLA